MSYILDALRKAAEQRGSTTSVLFRPAPVQAGVTRSWRTPWIVVGGLLALNVVVLAWVFHPTSAPDAPPPTVSESNASPAVAAAPPTAAAKTAPVVAPPPPGASSPAPAAGLAPAPTVPGAAPMARSADLVPPEPAVQARPKPPLPPPSARVTADRATPTEPRATAPARSSDPPAVEPLAPPRPRPERQMGVVEPLPQPTAPAPSVSKPAPGDRGRLKLEVVSYSDTPSQRLVFISGRKYIEGDTTEGGFRVEQIKEDSVVLSDQGVRFTLR